MPLHFEFEKVSKGRNLDMVAWSAGYMLVVFKGRGDQYLYGPGIPELRLEQLLGNPYPDALLEKVIKSKFKVYKVSK